MCICEAVIPWLEGTRWDGVVQVSPEEELVATDSARDLAGFLVGQGWGLWMRGDNNGRFEVGLKNGELLRCKDI